MLSNAPLQRSNVEQVAVARSFAANPDRVQEVPMAPYISPYIHVDVHYNQAVLQLRDSDTGKVEGQIPSEERLEQIRETEQHRQMQKLQQNSGDTGKIAEAMPQQQYQVTASETVHAEKGSATGTARASSQQLAAFSAGAHTASAGDTANVSIEA